LTKKEEGRSSMVINIEKMMDPLVSERSVEIVERKGKGHPDTLCDRAAEELSINLSRYYLEHFGKICHHNVDKMVLTGGRAEAYFGGGRVIKPIHFTFVGRATEKVGDKKVPLEEMATEGTKRWLKDTLRYLRVDEHIEIDFRIRPTSSDLSSLMERESPVPLANDTSMGVGYAPLSETERLVYKTEECLNSSEIKQKYPEIGEDIKVMGIRIKDKIHLTIAIAFIAHLVPSLDVYLSFKERAKELVLNLSSKITQREVKVDINTADDQKEGSVYLTVTGTSAEAGDDGQVGRGNRTNGLITPYRPMSLEAAVGKNPVSHVGKLYNILATEIAQEIIKIPEVIESECFIVSQIGQPIDKPQIVDLRVKCDSPISYIQKQAEEIILSALERLPRLWMGFINKEFQLY